MASKHRIPCQRERKERQMKARLLLGKVTGHWTNQQILAAMAEDGYALPPERECAYVCNAIRNGAKNHTLLWTPQHIVVMSSASPLEIRKKQQ